MKEIKRERCVSLVGDVSFESMGKVREKMEEIWEKDKKDWITFYISSGGGDILAGFAFYDYITAILKPKLQTIILGSGDSMATILFLMGEYRLIGNNAYIYMHEVGRVYRQDKRITPSMMEAELLEMRIDENNFARVFLEKTLLCKDNLIKLQKEDAVILPQKAVKLGFAHEILK